MSIARPPSILAWRGKQGCSLKSETCCSLRPAAHLGSSEAVQGLQSAVPCVLSTLLVLSGWPAEGLCLSCVAFNPWLCSVRRRVCCLTLGPPALFLKTVRAEPLRARWMDGWWDGCALSYLVTGCSDLTVPQSVQVKGKKVGTYLHHNCRQSLFLGYVSDLGIQI